MVWTKSSILEKLRKLHDAGQSLSYNALARKHQPLVSAAAYHFGSFRSAVAKAGIDYEKHLRRPHWTKQGIIKLIKQAKRADDDLHWSAVTARRDALGRAAFASLQPRLFGSWARALHAAGLDAEMIQRYRTWDRNTIVFELRSRASDREALNSGGVQVSDPGLHAAALRHFKSFDAALKAARIDPALHRRRRKWTRAAVLIELKVAGRAGKLSASKIRLDNVPLYGATLRHFGSFAAAKKAAKPQPPRRNAKPRSKR